MFQILLLEIKYFNSNLMPMQPQQYSDFWLYPVFPDVQVYITQQYCIEYAYLQKDEYNYRFLPV